MNNTEKTNDTLIENSADYQIPYIVYETAMARNERHVKRWMVAFFVALAMLFATNIGWIIYESQFETYYYAQDGEGINNVNIGEQGDIINGTETQNQEKEEQQG
jgi:hypothetical protein